MHYYKRNIGDYAKRAGRLSMIEHGSFTLLQDACYDREQFPTEAEAIEWCWARSPEEIQAVKFVLARFFELRDGVFVMPEIEAALKKYKVNAASNSIIAKNREEKKRTLAARTVHEPCTEITNRARNGEKEHLTINQEPRTKNQEPITPLPPTGGDVRISILLPTEPIAEKPKPAKADECRPAGVSDETWRGFCRLRTAKRAPVTAAAMRGIESEAAKAGWDMERVLAECCASGWAGFKADWVQRQRGNAAVSRAPVYPTHVSESTVELM